MVRQRFAAFCIYASLCAPRPPPDKVFSDHFCRFLVRARPADHNVVDLWSEKSPAEKNVSCQRSGRSSSASPSHLQPRYHVIEQRAITDNQPVTTSVGPLTLTPILRGVRHHKRATARKDLQQTRFEHAKAPRVQKASHASATRRWRETKQEGCRSGNPEIEHDSSHTMTTMREHPRSARTHKRGLEVTCRTRAHD